MKTKMSLVGVILVIALVACKKKTEETPVTASINIEEPLVGDTIMFGDTVHIHADVTGSAELHGYQLTVKNLTTQSELYFNQIYTHAASYMVHDHWVNNVTDTANVRLTIDVAKDHDGNHEIKTVDIVALPQ